MEDPDDYATIASEEGPRNVMSVNVLLSDGSTKTTKGKGKKRLKITDKLPNAKSKSQATGHGSMDTFKNSVTQLLAELLGMYDLETNIISYWTLDVLSQVIRKCQSILMKEENVKMCMLWIHYILYTIHKNHPCRKKLFKHLCIMFNRAMWQLPEITVIPHPYHLKQEMDKQRAEKKVLHIPIKKIEEVPIRNTMTNQEEEIRRVTFEEEIFLEEEFEGLQEDLLEDELGEDSQEQSLSIEEEKSEEEEELKSEEDNEVDSSDKSHEKITEKDLQVLPDEANVLPDEIKEKLQSIIHEIAETRKTNKRDFFLLIKIIYRIFANRFKYTVIWEAFAKPPCPKIIGIGNNIRTPKKIKIHRAAPTTKTNVKTRMSVNLEQKGSVRSKGLSAEKESLVKRFFPSVKKKKPKTGNKKSSRIRPLAEAVNQRFFDMIADHKYKEIRYEAYKRRMEAIKKRLNIKRKNYEKIREYLKTLIAKCKKKRAEKHKAAVRSGRGTVRNQ